MNIIKNLLITAFLLFLCYSCIGLLYGADCNIDKGQTCSDWKADFIAESPSHIKDFILGIK